MVYEENYGGGCSYKHIGEWHCPFSPEWVEMMKRAVTICQTLLNEKDNQKDAPLEELENEDFLSGPQDARGLPLWWCQREEERFRDRPTGCTEIYDYDTVPELLVTDGGYERPFKIQELILTA